MGSEERKIKITQLKDYGDRNRIRFETKYGENHLEIGEETLKKVQEGAPFFRKQFVGEYKKFANKPDMSRDEEREILEKIKGINLEGKSGVIEFRKPFKAEKTEQVADDYPNAPKERGGFFSGLARTLAGNRELRRRQGRDNNTGIVKPGGGNSLPSSGSAADDQDAGRFTGSFRR